MGMKGCQRQPRHRRIYVIQQQESDGKTTMESQVTVVKSATCDHVRD